jgi:AraC family transcriptional regulator
MVVTIIERAPAAVAGLRYTGPYGVPIGRFWLDAYVPWAVANRLGPDHARYGVIHDDPAVTPADACRYDACAEVAPGEHPDGATVTATMAGGRYAAAGFRGTAAAIGAAWDALLHTWLAGSGWRHDGRPCFEYYPRGTHVDPDTGEFACQLCVPVVPR